MSEYWHWNEQTSEWEQVELNDSTSTSASSSSSTSDSRSTGAPRPKRRRRAISWIRIVLGFLLIILDPTLFGGPFLLIGVALLVAGLICEDRS